MEPSISKQLEDATKRARANSAAPQICVSHTTFEALLAAASERDELRAANADLLACVDRAETAYCALERERDELRTDNATLTEAVAKARSVAREWEELCEKLTTELSRWPEEIAAALCATVKADRTVETWAAHVRREHEAHTETWSRFRDAKDESAALQAERDELRAELTARRLQVESLSEDMGAVELRAERAEAEVERLREALTPSASTKGAYHGEFHLADTIVPWTTIKDIMAAISNRAALAPRAAAKEARDDG